MNETHLDKLSGIHTQIYNFPYKVKEFELTITIEE